LGLRVIRAKAGRASGVRGAPSVPGTLMVSGACSPVPLAITVAILAVRSIAMAGASVAAVAAVAGHARAVSAATLGHG
jgi:hypothetical protein